MKKALMFIVVAVVQIVFAATPQVKNVKAFQQYPWENKVYISYEVVGDIPSESVLAVTAKDKTSGKTYDATLLSGDTGAAAGLHKIVWDAGAQGVSINSANVVFTVIYNHAYIVIDLSGGANATSYPISYLEAVPSGGWSDSYKTTKLVLRSLTAGTYKMQNTSNVTLTKPFYIGVFEVTQKQWELVMGSNPCSRTLYGKGNNYPVHHVSYNNIRGSSDGAKWPSSSAVDSDSFMGKLRARTGLGFDLPTEAQWEYACRAGTTTTYYWGNSMNGNYAWYPDNSSGTSHIVGTKTPNAWGLYDMSGNLFEWCLDWHGALAYGTDPKGSSSGTYRVVRGGGFDGRADYCTSPNRMIYYDPSSGFGSFGFRLVVTL